MSRRSPGLLILNLLIAGTILAAPWTGVFVGDPVRAAHGKGPIFEFEALLVSVVAEPLMAAAGLLLHDGVGRLRHVERGDQVEFDDFRVQPR